MNQTDLLQGQKPSNSIHMFRAMVGIGLLCALLIVVSYEYTLPVIKHNKAVALEKAVFQVIPGAVKRVTYKLTDQNTFEEMQGEPQKEQVVYAGYDANNQLAGIAVEASGQGFQDVLKLLYGYSPTDQKIIGFYVLESKETPGLGDKIEKDNDFLANFSGLDVLLSDDANALKNPVKSVKHGTKENPWEIDSITGATISSKAVGNIINNSISYWAPLLYKNISTFTGNQVSSLE
ncbi:MAG: FMN-binding protein [Calditrichae bacterium]|nr:FMN-binding protein [Calditrichota bacterium]MCB9058048.1 FMN-binding protein [Calditrichia bacterium]